MGASINRGPKIDPSILQSLSWPKGSSNNIEGGPRVSV